MKILALEDLTPRWYEPEGQETDEPVGFLIRPLDGEQYAEVSQHMRIIDGRPRFTAEAARVAFRHALLDWRALRNQSGETVPYLAANVKLLTFLTRNVLFAEIMDISELSEDQEKNSSSPLKSQETSTDSTA